VNSQHLRLLSAGKFCAIGESILAQTKPDVLKEKPYLHEVLSITKEKLQSFEELADFTDHFLRRILPSILKH
jgi:hypothetical protein